MQAILQATSGPAAGAKILVRPGQHVQVGRTRWADYSVPDDPALSDVHFAIHCGSQGCRIRDLKSGTGTLVNGVKVQEAIIHTGDQITAGQTTFSVIVEGESAAGLGSATAGDAGQNPTPAVRAPTAADFCGHIPLSEPARALLQEGILPAAFLDLLAAQQLFPDALRFLAAWLPKPAAVAWGCSCLQSTFGETCPPGEKAAIVAAQQWADDPTEDHRRATWDAAETAEFDTAAGLLALGAFSSGGSLAPPGVAPVPPAEGITAQMTAAALTIAATQVPPGQTADRYRGFLEQGKQLALLHCRCSIGYFASAAHSARWKLTPRLNQPPASREHSLLSLLSEELVPRGGLLRIELAGIERILRERPRTAVRLAEPARGEQHERGDSLHRAAADPAVRQRTG